MVPALSQARRTHVPVPEATKAPLVNWMPVMVKSAAVTVPAVSKATPSSAPARPTLTARCVRTPSLVRVRESPVRNTVSAILMPMASSTSVRVSLPTPAIIAKRPQAILLRARQSLLLWC